ncbi:MAG: TonB-dependent receptor domain-containing protein, partial [bacterium]
MQFLRFTIWNIFISLLFEIVFYPLSGFAQNHAPHAMIMGRVLDKKQNTPLAHVQVFIASIKRGDVTDLEGRFLIERVPVGTFDLIFKLQGYKTVYKSIHLDNSVDRVEINVDMSPTVIELKDLVITATRKMDVIYEVPQLVSLVTAKKIQDKNIQQTPEILREEVGVVVQKTNQGGGSPIIRGLKANKLLFLVDGIRLNNATYRGGNIQYLNTIDAAALQKVEVVHGPNSVMYGSDALGGVINVITRKPMLNHKSGYVFNSFLSANFSTADHTQSTHLNLMTANSRWGLLVEGSFKSFGDVTRGSHGGETLMQRLQKDSRTERVLNKTQSPNAYDAYDLNTKALFNLSESQQLTFGYQMNRQHEVPRYDVVETQKDSIRTFDPQERDLVYLSYFNNKANAFFNNATATISLHRQFERRLRQKFSSVNETTDQFRTLTSGFQLQFNKFFVPRHHLVYGADVYFDKVTTKAYQRNMTTNELSDRAPLFPDGSSFLILGLFGQDAFQLLPGWHLTVGARFSISKLKAPFEATLSNLPFGTIEQSSTALTGSFGLHYSLSESVMNLAQGFRTPNLDDVSKLGPGKGSSFFDVPNPDVGPEKSVSLDGGFKIYSEHLRANIIGFYNYITDLLVRSPTEFNGLPFIIEEGDTLAVFHKENAGQAYTTGIAMKAELVLSGKINNRAAVK